MGIPVTCPNGHEFKVKDKYAGKKGLCPYCKGQVAVRVPDATTFPNHSRNRLIEQPPKNMVGLARARPLRQPRLLPCLMTRAATPLTPAQVAVRSALR